MSIRYSKVQEGRKSFDINLLSDSLLKIGVVLKEAREKKSLTQKDIHQQTCIPLSHIHAIENGDRRSLPEDIFLLGFIKRYARLVELNEQTLCTLYLREKENKFSSKHEDEFDLLFRQEDHFKIIPFQKDADGRVNRHKKGKLLKVFQLYLLIGFVLLGTFAYMCLISMLSNQEKSTGQNYLVLENGSSTFDDDFKFDYSKIESWVSKTDTNRDKDSLISRGTDGNALVTQIKEKINQNGSSLKLNNGAAKISKLIVKKQHISKQKLTKSTLHIEKNESVQHLGEVRLRPLRVSNEGNNIKDLPLRRIRTSEL